MKFTHDQFTAIAFMFEKANGNRKSDFEEEVIDQSGLSSISVHTLEKQIIEGLKTAQYPDSKDRISCYWALGKIHGQNLIPDFRKWMKKELVLGDPYTVYQLLIALSNLGEPVWKVDREGPYSYDDVESNMRDAKYYLEKFN